VEMWINTHKTNAHFINLNAQKFKQITGFSLICTKNGEPCCLHYYIPLFIQQI